MSGGKNLIFMVSQPRAGSTMTQYVLSNSDRIRSSSETWVQFLLAGIGRTSLVHKGYNNPEMSLGAVKEYYESLPEEVRYKLWHEISSSFYELKKYPSQYFLDKTPRYYLFLDELRLIYPEAKIILLKRNPAEVLTSIHNTWYKGKSHRLVAKSHYEDLFLGPQKIQDFINDNRESDNVIEVKYEDLVKEPSSEFSRLFNFLDIDFDESLLNYSKNESLVGGYGDPIGVKLATIPSSNHRRKEVDTKTEKLAQDYLAFLGEDFLSKYGYGALTVKSKPSKSFLRFHSYGKQVASCEGSLKHQLINHFRYYI